MDKKELIKREEAAKIIQYEWRYYIFFNYDVCGECGYGGKNIGCGCSSDRQRLENCYNKIYYPYFDEREEV